MDNSNYYSFISTSFSAGGVVTDVGVSVIVFPSSLSLATFSFMASFLFLLARIFAWAALMLGSFFSVGGGGGGRRADASALSNKAEVASPTPNKPCIITDLKLL